MLWLICLKVSGESYKKGGRWPKNANAIVLTRGIPSIRKYVKNAHEKVLVPVITSGMLNLSTRTRASVQTWDNYLYAIIKVRNDLHAIEILKSSLVPSPKVSFTYVPLSLVFLVTASGKDDFALSYRMHQNFHSFLRCHCNILWFKKLHFFSVPLWKKSW